jgi:hypothetical protein
VVQVVVIVAEVVTENVTASEIFGGINRYLIVFLAVLH